MYYELASWCNDPLCAALTPSLMTCSIMVWYPGSSWVFKE